MKAPGFWSRPPGLLATLLAPLGWIYGRVTAARMARPGVKARVPVVCIGNFTAGGAGKTPTARWIAAFAAEQGLAPAILSRGYGGRLTGPIVVDAAIHGVGDVGDEPLLLAREARVIVARDRIAGAETAALNGARLLIMDDGLQNPSLAKDITIAVVDGGVGYGNGFCIPAGPLRAPVPLQMRHVDALVIIGAGAAGDAAAATARAAGKPVFRAKLAPDRAALTALAGLPLLAFAGIGRPEKFFDTLRHAGLDVAETRSFADHHVYSAVEAEALRADAAARGLTLVTTEKDAVRFPGQTPVLPVSLAFAEDDGARLAALLSARIRSVPSAA
jgi:tetraacyldisaccharide 4'-kinase